jgi:Tfp pilus assembly protein PilF
MMNAALRRKYEEGRQRIAQGEYATAIVLLREVVANAPSLREPRLSLANALYRAGDLSAALAEFEELYRRFPQLVESASNLAVILSELGHQEQAFHRVAEALSRDPVNAAAMCNLGEILKRLGNWEGARDAYAAAVAVTPDDPKLHLQHGLVLLGLGAWEEGWREYEHRSRYAAKQVDLEPVTSPRLQPGEPLAGRRVLVLHEQGLGDSVMFARVARHLAVEGAVVHFRCPEPLVPLLQQLSDFATCTATGSPVPEHDVHVPLMSVPFVLGLSPVDVSGAPYLTAIGPAPDHVRDALPADERLTVALCWSGNPTHEDNRRRSIPGAYLEPFRSLPGVRVAVMQKSPPAQDLLPEEWMAEWIDLGRICQDFSESAHALQQVDLVVTVDSAVAHLAGALGRPTLLLLPISPDFRWELGTDRTRWYDSVTLYRQTREFDWPSVIARVREEILARAAAHRKHLNS